MRENRDRYVREKLAVALECLAVSPASLQGRLANAGLSALSRLKPDDFRDPEDRELFERIMAALTSAEPRGRQGRIEATAAAMNDDEALRIARDIADLHGRVMPLF